VHVQFVIRVDPCADVANAGHNRHAAGPVSFLKVPAAHSKHVLPFGPVKPALHMQDDRPTLAKAEIWLLPHGAHGAPATVPYVPATHAEHALATTGVE